MIICLLSNKLGLLCYFMYGNHQQINKLFSYNRLIDSFRMHADTNASLVSLLLGLYQPLL